MSPESKSLNFAFPANDPPDVFCFSFTTTNFLRSDRIVLTSPEHQFMSRAFVVHVYPFCDCRTLADGSGACSCMAVAIGDVTGSEEKSVEFGFKVSVQHPSSTSTVGDKSYVREYFETKPYEGQEWLHFARRSELRREGYMSADGNITLRVKVIKKTDAVCSMPPSPGSLLTLLDDPILSLADVKLCGAGEGSAIVYAHKSVLCTVSIVFAKMVNGGFKESESDVIKFEDISSGGLEIVVRSLYGDYLPSSLKSNVQLLLEVWRFSSVNLLKALTKDCQAMLVSIVSGALEDETYFDVLSCAVLLESWPVLSELAWSFYDDITEISVSVTGLDIAALADENEKVRSILGSSAEHFSAFLKALPATLKTYSLIEAWLEYDGKRSAFAKELFAVFEIEDMPTEELSKSSSYALAAKHSTPGRLFSVIQKLASPS